MTPNKPNPRTIELEVRIDTPREAVCKALTEASELARWFPPIAVGKPGLGEELFFSWGPEIQWRTEVVVWEQGRHLVWRDKPSAPGTVSMPGASAPWRSSGRWRQSRDRWWCASSSPVSARVTSGTTSTAERTAAGASSPMPSGTTSSATGARNGTWFPCAGPLEGDPLCRGSGCGAPTALTAMAERAFAGMD
jgi:uncharacterized protein YndB with AHSA1/START domain